MMINVDKALEYLREYCEQKHIDYNKAESQLCAITEDCAMLCVSNPNAPPQNGLANDIDTLMLVTLYIRQRSDASFYVEETEYTNEFLL